MNEQRKVNDNFLRHNIILFHGGLGIVETCDLLATCFQARNKQTVVHTVNPKFVEKDEAAMWFSLVSDCFFLVVLRVVPTFSSKILQHPEK